MFDLTRDQLIASSIVLAYFAGGGTFLGLLHLFIKFDERKDKKNAKHRRPRMELDADLEHVEEALVFSQHIHA